MNVLLLFASIEGQTAKIAQFMADEITRLGHSPMLHEADDPTPLPVTEADAVILAAPVHQRRHPRAFEALVGGFRTSLDQRPTLMVSVSLSAAFPEGIAEAIDYVTEMSMRTRFSPREIACVAGAVRTTQYDYFATQVIRHVVLRDRAYDPAEGEHEFTDWAELSTRLQTFLEAAA